MEKHAIQNVQPEHLSMIINAIKIVQPEHLSIIKRVSRIVHPEHLRTVITKNVLKIVQPEKNSTKSIPNAWIRVRVERINYSMMHQSA